MRILSTQDDLPAGTNGDIQMAYERRYRIAFLISGMMAAAAVAISRIADAFSDLSASIYRAVNFIDWPDFRPDAKTSIELDVASHQLVDHRQPGIVSRFANFIRRAMTHDHFASDHFDPGRMPA